MFKPLYVACRLLRQNAKDLKSAVCVGAVEWRFLLSGVTLGTAANLPNPAPRWLTDKSWTQILNLSSLPAFQVDLQLTLCVFATSMNSVVITAACKPTGLQL